MAEDDCDHPSLINDSSRVVPTSDFLLVCGDASGEGRRSSVVEVGFAEIGSKASDGGVIGSRQHAAAEPEVPRRS